MEISDALVDKLAMLSRLHFSDVEKQEIKGDLQKMIGFIDKLNELDTSGVEPLLHISENINVLREDVVIQNISRDQARAWKLKNNLRECRLVKTPGQGMEVEK